MEGAAAARDLGRLKRDFAVKHCEKRNTAVTHFIQHTPYINYYGRVRQSLLVDIFLCDGGIKQFHILCSIFGCPGLGIVGVESTFNHQLAKSQGIELTKHRYALHHHFDGRLNPPIPGKSLELVGQ